MSQSERRRFTDDEIASALATLRANGGNAKKTAANLGISRTTLRAWAGRAHSTATGRSAMVPKQVDPEQVDQRSESLAAKFEHFAHEAVGAAPERISEMSGKDLLIAAGIATEKMQLLRGGPTSRLNTQIRVSLTGGMGLRELSAQVIEGQFRETPVEALSDQTAQRHPSTD